MRATPNVTGQGNVLACQLDTTTSVKQHCCLHTSKSGLPTKMPFVMNAQ